MRGPSLAPLSAAMQGLLRAAAERGAEPFAEATHTSMSGGKYVFGLQTLEPFLGAYAELVQRGDRSLSLVERPNVVSPVAIDIDLRQTCAERQYNDTEVNLFVITVFKKLARLVQVPDDAVAYVLEKPAPREAREAKGGVAAAAEPCALWKDGIHVMIPSVVTQPEVHMELRRLVLEGGLFPFTDYTNGPDDIYDKAVPSGAAGWLMYGSKKPKEPHAWQVTRLVDRRGGSHPCTEEPRDLVRRLLFRPPGVLALETPPAPEGANAAQAAKERRREEQLRRAAAEEARWAQDAEEGDGGEGGASIANGLTLQHLRALLDLLGPEHAAKYDTWMRVGWALHGLAGPGTSGERLALWKGFGAKCSSKFDEGEHDREWASMKPRSGGVTLGTVCHYAKEASPEGFKAWCRARPRTEGAQGMQERVQGGSVQGGGVQGGVDAPTARGGVLQDSVSEMLERLNQMEIVRELRAKVGLGLEVEEFGIEREGYRYTGNDGMIGSIHGRLPHNVKHGGQELGPLTRRIDTPLSLLAHDKNFPLNGMGEAELEGDGYEVNRILVEGKPPYAYLSAEIVKQPGCKFLGETKNGAAAAKRMTAHNAKLCFEGVLAHCASSVEQRFGITQNIFVQNNGSITVNAGRSGPERFSEVDLANTLQNGAPELFCRLRFVPDMKKEAGHDGLYYYCDPDTNLWALCSPTAELSVILTKEFAAIPGVTPEQCKQVESNAGNRALMIVVAKRVLDEQFVDKLDANPDLFAVANGVFDTSSGTPVFRRLLPEDFAVKNGCWKYSADDGKCPEVREELMTFLRQVLPVDEERDVVLKYFAGLLSGWRREKKFLVMTDRTRGDNGKSTLIDLMALFFGGYTDDSGLKFICQASFDKGRDAHDAGLQQLRGVRLLISDESKNKNQMDEGMIKRVVGGEGVRMSGRGFGVGDKFKYVWQAGIVMLFNEGDCPKFDSGDGAFLARMIVAPMRSKFVKEPTRENEFKLDDTLKSRFPGWMSALADLLTERYTASRSGVFANLPESMREWKAEIEDSANPLAEWLDEVVQVTGNPSDAVWVGELKNKWKETHFGVEAVVFTTKLVKAYFSGRSGVEWKVQARVKTGQDDPEAPNRKGVLRGVRIAAQVDDLWSL